LPSPICTDGTHLWAIAHGGSGWRRRTRTSGDETDGTQRTDIATVLQA
jgi:hypothetical protein